MIYRDKLEQEIINGIIELDKKGAVIGINNLVSINYFKTGEELLKDGHYISLDHEKRECLFKVAKYSHLERKELEEYFEHVCKTLLLIFVLIENLKDERYILIVGDSKPSALGSAFEEEFEKPSYKILYPELEEKLLALSGKEFIPTQKLIDYVKNNFRSIERVAIDEQLNNFKTTFKQQQKSINWTIGAVCIAVLAALLSAIPILKPFFNDEAEKIKLVNTKITVELLNDSLRIFSTNDTMKVYVLPLKNESKPSKK